MRSWDHLSYGITHAVLPATRQRWFSRLYPSVLPVLIYRPRKDEMQSWLRWLVISRWFNPQTVTHPSTNRAQRRVTTLIETNALTTKPDNHHIQTTKVDTDQRNKIASKLASHRRLWHVDLKDIQNGHCWAFDRTFSICLSVCLSLIFNVQLVFDRGRRC